MNNLYDGLGEVLLALLKSVDTREKVLEYLAEVIMKNSGRSRMQVNFEIPSYDIVKQMLILTLYTCLNIFPLFHGTSYPL